MENEERFPKRKSPRYSGYDYSQYGYYFLTVCVNERGKDILCHINYNNVPAVGADAHIGPIVPDENLVTVKLTDAGKIVKKYIENITDEKKGIKVESYVIMPDHVHLIISIQLSDDGPMWASAPTEANDGKKRPVSAGNISQIIRSMKVLSTKQIGRSIWQRSFYDKIIRRDEDLDAISKYIAQNPTRWLINHYTGN